MKRRIRKTIGAMLIILSLLVTLIPDGTVKAVNSDFVMNGTILLKYVGTEKSVSIPNGVTYIEYDAFSNCNFIEKISIPSSVTEIATAAFRLCESLTTVTIGSGLSKIGTGIFTGCSKLEEVTIDKDNESFVCEDGVIYNKDQSILYQMLPGRKSNQYKMPDTVNSMMKYGLWGCDKLDAVTLSNNLIKIPAFSFSNCKRLKEIQIPDSVKEIDAKAFENCINLESVNMPSLVEHIDKSAFDGCFKLNIQANENTVGDIFAKNQKLDNTAKSEYEDIVDISLLEADEPSNQTSENDTDLKAAAVNEAAADIEPINEIENIPQLPETPESEGEILGQTSIVSREAVVFIDNRMQKVSDGNSYYTSDYISQMSLENNDQMDLLLSSSNEKGFSFPKYTIVEQNKIANQAYYLNRQLESYNIQEGIESIGDFSFARSSISHLVIPPSVTSIGYGSFYYCDQLVNVEIPRSVTSIGTNAFQNTPWLNTWLKIPGASKFLVVGDGILIGYRGKDSFVNIPQGVKKIAGEVFINHKGIVEVSLPDTLVEIGEDAFLGCTNLTKITGGSNVITIKDRAFYQCPIESIRIPSSVQSIGLQAFSREGSNLDNQDSFVYFQGDQLPTIEYSNIATRYSNESYRNLVFEGVPYAVVDKKITKEQLENTVLDPKLCGFRGTVICITEEATPEQAGIANIIMCNIDHLEHNDEETIEIYGNTYLIQSSLEPSEYHKEGLSYQKNKSPKIQVEGVLSSFPTEEEITASIFDLSDSYKLKINEDVNVKHQLLKAYGSYFGDITNIQMIGFDLALFDKNGTIPIKKLGMTPMTIRMPIPNEVRSNSMKVLCLDDDGQLEAVPSQFIKQENGSYLEFTVKHFSPYGIYYTLLPEGVDSEQIGTLDYSPDTGDPIHPKWFLAIGLFCMGLISFFILDKREQLKYLTHKIK